MNLTEKILKTHLVSGKLKENHEIHIKFDQTLTQDVTAVMTYNAFMEMDKEEVCTKSVSYIDHNLLNTDYRTTDDHEFLKTVAMKYGIYYSPPGNGICHSIHLSRFTEPGKTLIGSDSHTPTAGAVGMFAIGSGGIDVALAMAGEAVVINMPRIININLTGNLKNGVNSKDIALEILKRLTVKGAINSVLEYSGDALENLSIFQRATIANMGAEMGATSSIFPSDHITYEFFRINNRLKDFKYITADKDAKYYKTINIDISSIKPNIAINHSPDNVKEVKDLKGKKISQVFIGSCTNSSVVDIKKVWKILKGRKINSNIEMMISTGTKANYMKLLDEGIISDLLKSGVRFTESACGACNGIGFVPATGTISLRTVNRNFKGRCGNRNAEVYLVSPETAAISALYGEIRDINDYSINMGNFKEEDNYNDEDIIKPLEKTKRDNIKIFRTENIKQIPLNTAPENYNKLNVSIKLADNISTDDICPTSASLSALRSNIELLSKYSFSRIDSDFYKRALKMKNSIIVAGENYGQGSSREHAAINVMYLGIKAVLVKSISRIHRKNLINHGVIPLLFKNKNDYDYIEIYDQVIIDDYFQKIDKNQFTIVINNMKIEVLNDLSPYEKNIVKSGGLINMIKNKRAE